jgi:hypothetical protein
MSGGKNNMDIAAWVSTELKQLNDMQRSCVFHRMNKLLITS